MLEIVSLRCGLTSILLVVGVVALCSLVKASMRKIIRKRNHTENQR